MAIEAFQRIISLPFSVFTGADREQAAMNAANGVGGLSDFVTRVPVWPSIEKFDNDTVADGSPSPFDFHGNPLYIWDLPISDGQTAAFGIESNTISVSPNTTHSFSVFLVAFADNAMEAKIELFEEMEGDFFPVSPQPSGLGDFLLVAGSPNTPDVGLIEQQPYNWQDIRVYSTRFTAPVDPGFKTYRIVVSFEATNYLIQPAGTFNPAGLQFLMDIYRDID